MKIDKSNKLKHAGFTLAEVLITLGIIGVVSAITIPSLMTKIQKRQLETQIKANYSSIQQAIKFADYDDVSYDTGFKDADDASMKNWFDTILGKHLKVESLCINKAGCWHKGGIVKDLLGDGPLWSGNSDVGIGGNIITFRTAKGAYYNLNGYLDSHSYNYFGVKSSTKDVLVFYFDANGDRKPNRIGKDIYIMVWTDKGLVPAGKW